MRINVLLSVAVLVLIGSSTSVAQTVNRRDPNLGVLLFQYNNNCEAIRRNLLMTNPARESAYATCVLRMQQNMTQAEVCTNCGSYPSLNGNLIEDTLRNMRNLQGRVYTDQCVFPARIPPSRLMSCAGWRVHPRTRSRSFHEGMDIPAPVGTPIFAPKSGCIMAVEESTSYGWKTRFDDNRNTHIFAHQQRPVQCTVLRNIQRRLQAGERVCVQAGEQIGCIGNTGGSEGPHLHWELRVKGMTPRLGAEQDNIFNAWNEVCDFDTVSRQIPGEKTRCDQDRSSW